MTKRYIKQLLIFVCLLLMTLTLTNCTQIYKTGFVSIPNQPISGPIMISSEWIELTPQQPLIPYGGQHWVSVKYSGYDITKNPIGSNGLVLKDGRVTKVEAIMFDDKGNSHELEIAGFGGGFDLYRKNEYFPLDRNYTKLRIRSEIPLQCNGIDWVSNVSH